MDLLQAMFPAVPEDTLRAVLEMHGDDVQAATNFLLSNDLQEVNANMQEPAAPAPPAPPAAHAAHQGGGGGGDDEDQEEEEEEEEDEVDEVEEEDEVEEVEEDEEPPNPPNAKKMRTVEPTPSEKLAGQASHFVKFDGMVLRKTYLELLNLSLSRLAHTSVTLWSEDQKDQRAATAMLEGDAIGWWVQHYPVAEVDHVWRVIVNSHHSKAFASVVNVSASSFAINSGAELEVRVLVRDAGELTELKRAGAGLLSVAPSSRAAEYVFFQRGPLKASTGGGRESKTRLEEKSDFKLQKERQSRADPARSQYQEPDRMVYQLYKVESSSPTKWVKVDV